MMQIQTIGATRTMSTREIKAYSTVARPGCYMTAEERQEYRSIVESSELHDSAKRILKWLIGFKTPDMALSVNTIRERLPKATKRDHEAATAWVKPDGVAPNAKKALMSERTIQRVLRLLEDDGIGLGVLRLIAEEKRGRKIPRTYEIDLAPITDDGLAGVAGHAAEHNKRADVTHSEVSSGVTNGVSLEVTGWGVTSPSEIQSDTPSDTLLLKNTVFSSIHRAEVATERLPMGVDLSAMSRFSAKVIQFPQRHLDGQAFDHHGKASLSSASFDDVNAELRAACDEPAFSMAARSVA